jgi:hypothetical protein
MAGIGAPSGDKQRDVLPSGEVASSVLFGALAGLGGELIRDQRCARLAGAALIAVVVGLWGSTSSAGAFIYWANTDGYSIGRANVDGSGATDAFLSFGYQIPCGVAVSGNYIYWSEPDNISAASIARAPVDGSGKPDDGFIIGASSSCGLAVYGHHLYWANGGVDGSIGRASLSGPTDVQENFVPSEQASGGHDLDHACGIAVDATGIYWSDRFGNGIGHANLDGTGERTLIPNADSSCGVALAGGYLYWTDNPLVGASTIGRALETGAQPDKTFITGLNDPCGAAVNANYLYFADGSTIDRTDLSSADPTASTQQIAFGNRNACGVALDNLYEGQLTLYRPHSRKHGLVTLTLGVSNPGQIEIRQMSGRPTLIKPAQARALGAGRLSLTLHPTVAGTKRLLSHASATTRIKISYTPRSGVTTVKSARVVLLPR